MSSNTHQTRVLCENLCNTSPNAHKEKKHLKRKLFASPKEKENNRDILKSTSCNLPSTPEKRKNLSSSTPRYCVPLSERQQIALVLKLTAFHSSTSPEKALISFSGNKHIGSVSGLKNRYLYKKNERGETPLHVASIRGDSKKVRRLLQQGAEVNARDFAGWTSLHEACNHGWAQVAKLLIKFGADVNAQGLDSDTPLHDAAINGHTEIINLLLKYGADPTQRNAHWRTPLDVAQSEEVLETLKKGSIYYYYNSLGSGILTAKASSTQKESENFPNYISVLRTPEASTERQSDKSPCHPSRICQPTMRKNSPQNQTHKGADKPTSPRLTLRFQSIRTRDDKNSGSSKVNDVSSTQPKYQSYCVTMETKGDVYEFRKDDGSVSSTQSSASTPDSESYDLKPDVVSSSSGKEADVTAMKDYRKMGEVNQYDQSIYTQKVDSSEVTNSKVNGGRVSGDCSSREHDCTSDVEKEENRRKRRKSSDNSTNKHVSASHSNSQRSHRGQSCRINNQDGHSEQRSPKSRKRGSLSSSDTESNPSDGDNEVHERNSLAEPSVHHNGASLSGPHSPKVPPLKIVIPPGLGGLESETRERSKVSSSKQALPYVVNTAAETEGGSAELAGTTTHSEGGRESGKVEVTSCKPREENHPPEERFQRVTRSSHRIQAALAGASSSSSSSTSSQCHNTDSSAHSNVVSSSVQKGDSGDSSTDEHHQTNVDVHPRKRKLRPRDNGGDSGSHQSSSSSSSSNEDSQQQHQLLNCYQMYLNIRKQVDKRRRSMFVVHPKPPQGFKDYLLNRCSYVLEGNAASRLSVPMIPPPQSLTGSMRELFVLQEKERYRLRLQHLIEREKLVLSAEQEILRVHGRAARAMANQTVPLSACSILKDEEIYNVLEGEQEDKDKNVRSRYNGRLFLSWLQDVDDKWEKIKEAMLLRHHNEAESLHAVQKLDWEWKMKELAMCDVKATPAIDDISVPMVHVSDEFDLLPA